MSDNTPVQPHHGSDEPRPDADVTPEFSSPASETTADPIGRDVPLETDGEERTLTVDREPVDDEPVRPEPIRAEPVDAEPAVTEHTESLAAPAPETEAPALVEPPQPERVSPLEAPVAVPVVAVPAEERAADIDNVEVIPAPTPVAPPQAQPFPQNQTVYVEAPNPPKKRGNRGIGALLAILGAIVFGLVFALVVALILAARTGEFSFDFVSRPNIWVPVLFFVVGFILLVLIVNRAAWWVHVIGSIFVALFVYFGTVATLLFINGVLAETAADAGRLVAEALVDPFVIAAALVAREVALWFGLAISARGRRMKARNVEARAEYEAQVAERRSEYERASV